MGEIVHIDPFHAGEFFAGASCAFGVFDGFHRGHRLMIDEVCASAAEGAKSVVITFDRDPDEVFAAARLKKLFTNDARIEVLAASGVDAVAVLPFVPELSSLPPAAFLETLFGEGAPAVMHVGIDFGFGCRGAGRVADLAAWGAPRGMTVVGHELLTMDDAPITATRIRGLLAAGNVAQATRLLGHPYVMEGEVVHGRGSGTEFGIPTANIALPENLMVVGEGVYGCRVTIGSSTYNAAVCIGIPPTFEGVAKQQVEAHIIDFEGDLYGRTLALEVVQFIRPNRVFVSVEELVETLKDNIATIRATQPLG